MRAPYRLMAPESFVGGRVDEQDTRLRHDCGGDRKWIENQEECGGSLYMRNRVRIREISCEVRGQVDAR